MKKMKIGALVALAGFSVVNVYADDAKQDALSPVGYWVQYDEDNDAGKGMPEGIIQSTLEDNGTLSMKIVVPLMMVNDKTGKVSPPLLHCDDCGNGSKNGFKYDYEDASKNLIQGLVFAGNMQKQASTNGSDKGFVYDHGGVLNPNDGKTYSSMVQVQDGGETLFARAYLGPSWDSWRSAGKNAHWKRIDEAKYQEVKKLCGLTDAGVYPYQDKDGKLKDKELFEKCSNYDFGVKKPV